MNAPHSVLVNRRAAYRPAQARNQTMNTVVISISNAVAYVHSYMLWRSTAGTGVHVYCSIISSTSTLEKGDWPTPRPGRYTGGGEPGSRFTGCWVGPITGLDGCGISSLQRDSSPYSPSSSESLYRLCFNILQIRSGCIQSWRGCIAPPCTLPSAYVPGLVS